MTTPYLSVIVPVYNVEKYITQCLVSMVGDKAVIGGMAEVIIVDDGSTDASGEIADDIASGCSFVQVIHQENSGVAQARNTGIQAAIGKWLYFVDSDDWLEENALSVLCQMCREHEEADILFFDAYRNTETKQIVWEHFKKEKKWCDTEIISLQGGALYFPILEKSIGKTKVPLAAPWDKVFKKSLIESNALTFREHLHVLDDMVFVMEALGYAKRVYYVKEKIYHYRYVSDSITNVYKKNRVENDKEVFAFVQKYIDEWAELKTAASSEVWTNEQKEMLMQAFYCRVIKSFSICCRLQFFNSKNENRFRDKIKYVRCVLSEEPYKEAFSDVKISNLEWKLKIMTLMGRYRLGEGIYLLHLAESMLFKLRH